MATDRQFTHPNFGRQVRVEVWGREVRLTFTADNSTKAEELAEYMVDELKRGSLDITVMGQPTGVEET